jgi:ribosomal protein S27AE
MRFKELLWKLGLTNEYICPRCAERLIKSGFAGSNERFSCSRCDFGR